MQVVTACGAVVQQKHNDEWVPLGFCSKDLKEKEKASSTFNRKLTALYKALHHFRHLVERHSFNIYTDHMTIVKAMEKPMKGQFKNNPECYHFSQFDATVLHNPGKEN